MVAVTLALALAAPAHAEPVRGVDLTYFDGAPEGLAADVSGVLEIVVSHPRKPSRGFRRLPFQPEPDPDADPVVDCKKPQPVLRPGPEGGPETYEVCGVRLLRWSIGDVAGDSSRIELPFVREKVVDNKRWLQVILDPGKNLRGWVEFVPERSGLMRAIRLFDWATGGRHSVVRARTARTLVLHAGPSYEKEPVPFKLPRGSGDLSVEVHGMQGAWARVEPQTEACLMARERDSDAPCPEGWMPWRDDSGEPLLYPKW
ncbi:MAG: hypothetical protein NTX64_18620 [Elusimicrobia bacterium]|nr:hypothetical protein [Elusimicrobiota bacterium]